MRAGRSICQRAHELAALSEDQRAYLCTLAVRHQLPLATVQGFLALAQSRGPSSDTVLEVTRFALRYLCLCKIHGLQPCHVPLEVCGCFQCYGLLQMELPSQPGAVWAAGALPSDREEPRGPRQGCRPCHGGSLRHAGDPAAR